MSARPNATRYEVAVPDQFDLRGPAGRFHRSADCAGGVRVRRLRRCCPLGVTGAADRGRRGCRLCPYQLPCQRYSPCKDGPAPDLPWRPAAGDCLMGFNSVSWGSTRLSWSSGPVCEAAAAARKIRAAAEGRHRAFLMNKRNEAAAAVRPDSAAPFRLTILADSAAHRAGLVRRAGDAASFRLRIAGPAGPFVLAWRGDRSPIRGCTTTGGDRVPPRTRILVRFPQNDQHLNTHARAAGPHGRRPGLRPRCRLLSGRQP